MTINGRDIAAKGALHDAGGKNISVKNHIGLEARDFFGLRRKIRMESGE